MPQLVGGRLALTHHLDRPSHLSLSAWSDSSTFTHGLQRSKTGQCSATGHCGSLALLALRKHTAKQFPALPIHQPTCHLLPKCPAASFPTMCPLAAGTVSEALPALSVPSGCSCYFRSPTCIKCALWLQALFQKPYLHQVALCPHVSLA